MAGHLLLSVCFAAPLFLQILAQDELNMVTGVSGAPKTFTVPAEFPSSVFPSYYYGANPTQEPQPIIYDPVLDYTYPLNLTDPTTIPTNDTDPAILPNANVILTPAQAQKALQKAISQIVVIASANSTTTDNCTKCLESVRVLQTLSQKAPQLVSEALVSLCELYALHSNSTCELDFNLYTYGSVWTQVIRYANISALDGQYICYYLDSSTCDAPTAYPPIDASLYFPKPKPTKYKTPKASGKRVKVLHMSDFHLDPRYSYGAESDCASGLCCRTNVFATGRAVGNVSVPAPLYGAFLCDTPYWLGLGALQAVHPLTGTVGMTGYHPNDPDAIGWTIYTGDLVSHDPLDELSREYTEYAETSIYHMFHNMIRGAIFPVLGNHDTNPEAQDAPHSLPGSLGAQMSWNYDHVAGLWHNDGFLPASASKEARLHYGGYSVKNQYGLRIITLNTDFWYHSNIFNYINAANPDVSGMLKWVIDELQSAEDNGERVWLLGHVLTGWDGTNPLPNPTDFLYQIIDRYSPHVIANTFWGHTHEDQVMIYYANNGTNRNNSGGINDAQTSGWICPSVTPLTNLNSGFRMYEVDTGNFEIFEAYTWFANVSAFDTLDTAVTGPAFEFEYSTREAYGAAADWPTGAPLNATFWHKVTETFQEEALAGNFTLTEMFNTYQGKSSVKSPVCDTLACALAKVCYMRSGSNPLGKECPQGYGSVQSAFDPA